MADEPTGNLDTKTGEAILRLLQALSVEHGQTVVLIPHDREVDESAPRLIELSHGRIIDEHPGREQ